ncbi:MAG: DUF6489 family protein [Phenylobacterium sp.]|jgi:hypothetical protein|uniref:DUF6489 family protein n=1 Tax=Phenylobacterium sp. TaxID=1871053 RepID=UPI002A360DF1|nr:DUF6489 family protein [Phenylobacterium sp.]MDX9998211.1 DUF6489 family protein [Phenylobacterium sp.]
MKMTIEVECTPQEARAFLGLPDVTPLNEKLVSEMQARMEQNIAMLSPDEMLKTWASFGAASQEQFRKLMTAAADNMLGGAGRTK